MNTTRTDARAERAYRQFAAQPLAKISGGVDRASFIAGYDTAQEEYSALVVALQRLDRALVPVARAIGPTGADVWPEIAEALIQARAALAQITED